MFGLLDVRDFAYFHTAPQKLGINEIQKRRHALVNPWKVLMRYVAKFLDSHFSWCVVNSKIDEGYTSLLSDRRDLCRTMRVDYVMKKVSKQIC